MDILDTFLKSMVRVKIFRSHFVIANIKTDKQSKHIFMHKSTYTINKDTYKMYLEKLLYFTVILTAKLGLGPIIHCYALSVK